MRRDLFEELFRRVAEPEPLSNELEEVIKKVQDHMEAKDGKRPDRLAVMRALYLFLNA